MRLALKRHEISRIDSHRIAARLIRVFQALPMSLTGASGKDSIFSPRGLASTSMNR
jgi:hypothetical protein